ncbi:hypothetical protein HO173_013253 [Letharia columbiana]|uniref:guanosine-diphosphatase n=1 Tax=Letharia columbiana TaxID=112416 RepID=A0A8H6CGL3_9LECA|nr:uncharacterized protein HO173_013253 [Letharia columbiana]KAF6223153.1 hypothetical protein HO173_013253 [Letharia columbiana]
MSTAFDARRRPSLWSYLSFNSKPRRRSSSLPKHETPSPDSKENTPPKGSWGRAGNLEGYKEASMTGGQRARLLKTAGFITLVVLLLYLFTSRDGAGVRDMVQGAQKPSSTSTTDKKIAGPLGTTKCSKSSSKEKPLIQYALMIDAGSTGSRIHVYKFNNCGSTPELESEEFKMTEKKEGGSGLSSYGDDAEGAAKSLDMLLEVAMKTVPDKLKGCSPIAVKATAGLRKLDQKKEGASKKILDAVRNRLETKFPFPVVSAVNGGVEVMDGKDEGVYAWITTNYLLGKIGGPDKSPTAAVFDLGGGSTQIVFEPTFKSPSGGMPETLHEGEHKYVFKTGGTTYELYQHSHLGYGLMAARESIHKSVVQALHDASPTDKSWASSPISNPCIAPGMSREVNVTLDSGDFYTTTMAGPKDAASAQCRGLAEKILLKDKQCDLAPCSFGGIHQPSLEKTFAREDVYIFSYFFDRTKPLGMPESFTVAELRDLTAKVCEGEKGWASFGAVEGALEELKGRPEYCLDLNFMVGLLHTGYDMGLNREVKIAKKIKGNELGWCLGASLPLLSQESGWKCKVTESH